jgi:hypothetical protein
LGKGEEEGEGEEEEEGWGEASRERCTFFGGERGGKEGGREGGAHVSEAFSSFPTRYILPYIRGKAFQFIT